MKIVCEESLIMWIYSIICLLHVYAIRCMSQAIKKLKIGKWLSCNLSTKWVSCNLSTEYNYRQYSVGYAYQNNIHDLIKKKH